MAKERTELGVIRAKIKQSTYTTLLRYCAKEKTNISAYVRQLIENNVEGVVPLNQAGQNVFEYNKATDSYTWLLHFDQGPKTIIGENLKSEFIQDLLEKGIGAIELRKAYLKQKNPESVPIPNHLKKIIGGKSNAHV